MQPGGCAAVLLLWRSGPAGEVRGHWGRGPGSRPLLRLKGKERGRGSAPDAGVLRPRAKKCMSCACPAPCPRREYDQALWLLRMAFTMPCGTTSAIAVAAAKKWLLLHVLCRGDASPGG